MNFMDVIRWLISIPIISLFIAPIIWLFVTPFSAKPSLSISINEGVTLNNFIRVFKNPTAILAFRNSLIISAGTVFTFSALLAAYVLSRHYFRGRDILLYLLILLSSVVTGIAAMVPLFMMNLKLGLIDKHLGVILTMSGGLLPTSIFILKDFIDSIPKTYEEAALVDGSTPFQVLTKIFLPLSSKGIIVIAMLVFVNSWSNFLIPFILLRSNNLYPISIAIYTFFSEIGVPDIGMISAYSLMYTLPVNIHIYRKKIWFFVLRWYERLKGEIT